MPERSCPTCGHVERWHLELDDDDLRIILTALETQTAWHHAHRREAEHRQHAKDTFALLQSIELQIARR